MVHVGDDHSRRIFAYQRFRFWIPTESVAPGDPGGARLISWASLDIWLPRDIESHENSIGRIWFQWKSLYESRPRTGRGLTNFLYDGAFLRNVSQGGNTSDVKAGVFYDPQSAW